MFYVFCVIAVAVLAALYKFLPDRKLFIPLCVLLFVVFCAASFIQGLRYRHAEFTREQIEEIRQQQQIFVEWYADYQKILEQLDRNWQSYYSIVETLQDAEIYELRTYERLSELEGEVLDAQKVIHDLEVPSGLDYKCGEFVAEMIIKTRRYSDAQVKTISLVREAANPLTAEDLSLLNLRIKDITIREAPAGLFVAAEVSNIRELLTIPGEEAQ